MAHGGALGSGTRYIMKTLGIIQTLRACAWWLWSTMSHLLKRSPPSHTVPPSWGSSIQTNEFMETFQIQTITDTPFLVRDCWVWVPFSRCSSQQILLLYFLSGLGPFLHFLTPHLSVGEGTMCFLPPGWSWRRRDCNIRLYCCEHDLWSHGKLCVNHFPAPADYVILTEQPKYSVPQAQ